MADRHLAGEEDDDDENTLDKKKKKTKKGEVLPLLPFPATPPYTFCLNCVTGKQCLVTGDGGQDDGGK